MDANTPPVILVKTWITLINSKESEDVRQHATQMLMNAFEDDIHHVATFCKQHNIAIN